jgi:hypothetical protein
MMIKRLITLFLLLPVTLLLLADNGRQQAARQRAATLLGADVELAAKASGDAPCYFIYNAQPVGHGFVVLAGNGNDAQVPAVLGYSPGGSYQSANVPPAFSDWLARMEQELMMVRQGLAEPYRVTEQHDAVAPLLTTQWDQHAPYNLEAPEYEKDQRSATGCLATAMAQILKYYASEVATTAIPAYTSRDIGLLMPELPATTFDYALMQDRYLASDRSASALEVARLMKYCGQSVSMNYGPASSADPIIAAFTSYFDYNPFAYYAERYQYPAWAWDKLIYKQLSEAHPVLMTGHTFSAAGSEGHAFICDGYDGNGLYHFNWGWGGDFDGWYALSLCNPLGQGAGGTQGLDGFNIDQGAMINVFPDVMSWDVRLTVRSLSAEDTVVKRDDVSEDFSFGISAMLCNLSAAGHLFDFGLGIYENEDQLFGTWTVVRQMPLMPCQGISFYKKLAFGEDISSGDYVMRCVCRDSGTTPWLWGYNGDLYLRISIRGNTLTISEPEPEWVVEHVSFEGKLKPHTEAVMHVTLKNVGGMLYNNLYLFVNGKQASGIGLFADKDESQDVSLHFVVPEGDVSLMLCTDAVEVDEQTHEYKPAGYLVWTGDLSGTTGIVSPVVTPAESFDEAGSSLGNVAADGAAQVYDLQGRRVLRPTQKGVYIRNGRLHVVR